MPRQLVFAILAGAVSWTPAHATWSVVAANRATGEIGVGQATCIVGPNLQQSLAVVRPGVGAGCVQQWWDNGGEKRVQIWKKLKTGFSPQEILDIIQDPIFQFGVVDLNAQSATYTGGSGGAYKGGVANQVGDLSYAIQGNVLAGQNVVLAAEQALLNTQGDMADRLMAAMLAAAQAGGDGRCSCSFPVPASCGAPPPGFDLSTAKSAHTGFLIVSRVGDSEGTCNGTLGCANGTYYLNLNAAPGQNGLPDPIVEMSGELAQWRSTWIGRPDHLKSSVTATPASLPGNGTAATTIAIKLADYQGTPIPAGGASIVVSHAPGSAGLATFGAVVDHNDGTYSVGMTAGVGQGTDRVRVMVDDGLGAITLYPYLEVVHEDTLIATPTTLSASAGGTISFTLDGPDANPPHSYLLLGSASGTSPGVPLSGATLPLNYDWLMLSTFALQNSAFFPQSAGILGPGGSATAQFVAPAGITATLVGQTFHFAFLIPDTLGFASNASMVTITL